METSEQQSQKSVDSFGWQWVSKTVKDSRKISIEGYLEI